MPYFNINKHYKIYILLFSILQPSKPYQILSFDNLDKNQLCTTSVKQKISLGLTTSSGLILSLTNAEDLKNDFVCEFQVDTLEPNNGLFAVIQKIELRSDYLTNECIDYIVYRRNNASISRQYCDIINMNHVWQDDVNLMPTLQAFVEPKGVLDVYINISKKQLKPHQLLKLEIVFTSYRYCFRNTSQEDRPCSSKYATHCIYKDFFYDGYDNCPYPGCVDESKCLKPVVEEKIVASVLNVIVATTIATVALVLIATLVTIYLCCKFRSSWSINPQVIEANELTTMSQSNTYALVPPNPPEYEGLPPSYKSLFPDK